MQINNSRILILGGWGLVGSAICHKLMLHNPKELIVTSLNRWEAEDAVKELSEEYKNTSTVFTPKWGNIFTREEWKDENWRKVLENDEKRRRAIKDIFYELDEDILDSSCLYKMINDAKPDAIIDCINTATAIAYLNIYDTTLGVIEQLDKGGCKAADVEKLISSSYIPQLIRHVQIFNKAMLDAKTTIYLKIGTSGTGGMGMNIPYTHSEERPSRVLLSKTAVAGAQTLLLFLLGRTPGGPIVKEIKPTAAIAWKKIAYGEIKKHGSPIKLFDMAPSAAKKAEGDFVFDSFDDIVDTNEVLESVFIDTGENGIFSRGEFQAISSLGQMEIITPEEIAEYAVFEIRGGNSGHDILQGLDSFTLGPTYRGGMMQNRAVEKIANLEAEKGKESVAFELLGPPRLSKLLFEAHILKMLYGSLAKAKELDPSETAKKADELAASNEAIRKQILSIGLPILLSDGKKYLRGKTVKIPVRRGKEKIEITPENLKRWRYEGWIDLTEENFSLWKNRIAKIIEQAESVGDEETSSRFAYTKDYWKNFETIDEGKIGGWIFEFEDLGWRFKR